MVLSPLFLALFSELVFGSVLTLARVQYVSSHPLSWRTAWQHLHLGKIPTPFISADPLSRA